MNKDVKLLSRIAVGYWDIKFQMERQAQKIKKDYKMFQNFRNKKQ